MPNCRLAAHPDQSPFSPDAATDDRHAAAAGCYELRSHPAADGLSGCPP